MLAELGKRSGLVIATGGGCVTRAENYPLLHQNGTIFCLTREWSGFPWTEDLSRRRSAQKKFIGAGSLCMKNLQML